MEIPEIIHESWHPYLQPLFDDKKMAIMKNDIIPRTKFYPPAKDIFKVFRMPLNQIKVVILGQDPYINAGEAMGYAFAVPSIIKIPPSLQIIKNEILQSKVERDSSVNISSDKWQELKHWRQQGVFLLNAALTVEFKNSGSHMGIWQWFTREVVKIISKEVHPLWMLWGSPAKAFRDYIDGALVIKRSELLVINTPEEKEFFSKKSFILEAYHPVAEVYPDSKYKFTGCNHFNLCNEILKIKGNTIINW